MFASQKTTFIDGLAIDRELARHIRAQRNRKLRHRLAVQHAVAIERLPSRADLKEPFFYDLWSDHVAIGRRADLDDIQFETLKQIVYGLSPWRKGPFRLFDWEIEAEWRSNLKWDRVLPALGPLKDRFVMDIGCGNGYYMFRAAAHQPRLVLGIDPSVPFFYSYSLMQRFLQLECLHYELMGVADVQLFQSCFDIVLCMGIIYHHRNPIAILRDVLAALKQGGTAIVESQTIPGDGSTALFPEDRYAKARNIYFVPTRDCLINWIRRAGFKNVELVSHVKVTTSEQRATEFMRYESLVNFLDPRDDRLTIEGYPAPYRTVVRGQRKS
jgi:tRNA (mo5U34)-methyltransferase